MVPVSSDGEYSSEDEQEGACGGAGASYSERPVQDAANRDYRSGSEIAGSDTDGSETEAETDVDDEYLSSGAEPEHDGDASLSLQQDTPREDPRWATPRAVTPILRTIATRSCTQRTLKRVRYADSSSDSDSDVRDHSDVKTIGSNVRRPAVKKARRKYPAQAQGMTRRTRMSKAQATSLWTRDDAVCGMDGCKHTVNRAGSGWKRHLDAVHYAAQASSDDERGERTPMAPAAATSSRGANQATSRKKAKTTRKVKAKSKSQSPIRLTCLHADCEEDREFTTTDILYRHIQTVHWKWTFSCPSCGQAFTRLPNMNKHLSAGHPGDELPVPEDDP
ncbi:hypothetical protein PYCCODRAFT_342078 [Trametes coccinea BRFM310]|uniref:C2H2-type domain-containing protein n=1 Tax=Trametes coccinea (strain BRFM310) TaxID=1353009 RepID=A0A1Y2J5H5_TRAC3|nr:hypothetical protein PYCCODRAFT_342078 [Trametes coccinea BRFM310]